jgi:phosphoserine phosphatase
MIMSKNYTSKVEKPRKLAIVDLDDCVIDSEFALDFVKILKIKKIILPKTYDEVESSHSEYKRTRSKKSYGKIVNAIIDVTGQILKGASVKKVNMLAKDYAKVGSKYYWMPYTSGLLGLFSEHHYTKATLTAMPEELAFEVSRGLGVNEKYIYPTSYEKHRGEYKSETRNAYTSNGSKKKKADKIIKSFNDAGLKERTLIIDNSPYGPFESAKWGILVNFQGELSDYLQDRYDAGKLLVCRPDDDVIGLADPFLRTIDESMAY